MKFNQIVYLRNSNSAKYFAGFPIGFNIAVGGLDEKGHDTYNDLSMLCLETLEEAEAFLEDCMASIVDNIGEVREFLDQEGMDVSGMSDEEIEDASEVFALSDGRYLIVEG